MGPDVFLSVLADKKNQAEELGKTRTETVPFALKRWFVELEGIVKPRWGIKAEGAVHGTKV